MTHIFSSAMIQKLRVGPSNLYLNKPSRGFWCTLKSENHCLRDNPLYPSQPALEVLRLLHRESDLPKMTCRVNGRPGIRTQVLHMKRADITPGI